MRCSGFLSRREGHAATLHGGGGGCCVACRNSGWQARAAVDEAD